MHVSNAVPVVRAIVFLVGRVERKYDLAQALSTCANERSTSVEHIDVACRRRASIIEQHQAIAMIVAVALTLTRSSANI